MRQPRTPELPEFGVETFAPIDRILPRTMPERARQLIADGTYQFAMKHPGVKAHGAEFDQRLYELWEGLRYKPYSPDGKTLEDALSIHGPLSVLRDVWASLIASGDLETTLRRCRDELNRHLDVLERRRQQLTAV